jgi:hypothetical protein
MRYAQFRKHLRRHWVNMTCWPRPGAEGLPARGAAGVHDGLGHL